MTKNLNNKKYPNFLIGGTSAGGTSFLSAILKQHPMIFLPKKMRPEPHYFYKSWEYTKGDEYYLKRWFNDVPKEAKAIGERSSSYMFGGDKVALKVKKFNAEMKFIFILRNPIERAWANYRYSVLEGIEENSFEFALKNEKERVKNQKGIWAEIQPFNYTGRGYYYQQIIAFLKHFPEENILLIKSELLSSNTNQELKKILNFLNLDVKEFPYNRASDHTSFNVINPMLQLQLRFYFKDRFDILIEAIRKNEDIDDFAKNNTDKDNIQKLKDNLLNTKQNMSSESRLLLQSLYRNEISHLKCMVDFNLNDWQ